MNFAPQQGDAEAINGLGRDQDFIQAANQGHQDVAYNMRILSEKGTI